MLMLRCSVGVALSGYGDGGACCVCCVHASTVVSLYSVRVRIRLICSNLILLQLLSER